MKFDSIIEEKIKETVNREAEAWDEKDVEKLLSNFTSIRCCHLSTILPYHIQLYINRLAAIVPSAIMLMLPFNVPLPKYVNSVLLSPRSLKLIIVLLSNKKDSLVIIYSIDMLEMSVELVCAITYNGGTKRKETPSTAKIKNIIRNVKGIVYLTAKRLTHTLK